MPAPRPLGRLVLTSAFVVSGLVVGIEMIGFAVYLTSFHMPEVAPAIPEWIGLLLFLVGIYAPFFGSLVFLFASVVELAWSPRRFKRWSFLAAVHFAVLAGSFVLDRFDTPRRAVARSTRLVEAILEHERDHGTPPSALEGLLPGYLEELPDTGCPSYRGWDYRVVDDGTAGRRWSLRIDCSHEGFGAFESLTYDRERLVSSQEQRIGDWIYWRD